MSFAYTWTLYSKDALDEPVIGSVFVGVHDVIKRGTFLGVLGTPSLNIYGLTVSGASVKNACVWLEDPRTDIVSAQRYVYMIPRRAMAVATTGADAPNKTIIKMMSPGWVSPMVLEPCQMSSKLAIPDLTVPLVAATYFDGTPSVGARALVKDQATASQNGIYQVITYGSGNVTLLRAPDMCCSADLYSGAQVAVVLSISITHWYSLHIDGYSSSPTLGTTNLTWQPHLNYAGNGATDDALISTTPVRLMYTATGAPSGYLIVDGVQTVDGDRVLVTGRTSHINNGVFVVGSGAWTRDSDMKTSDVLLASKRYSITEGSVYGGRSYGVVLTSPTLVVDTDSVTFVEILSLTYDLADSTKWHMWPTAPYSEDRALQLGNASTGVDFTARTRKIAVGVFTPTTEYDGLESDPNFTNLYHDRIRLMSSFNVCPPGVQS